MPELEEPGEVLSRREQPQQPVSQGQKMSRQQDNRALIREKGELPLWRGWRQAPAKHRVTLGHNQTGSDGDRT